jgi:hypothetical protein
MASQRLCSAVTAAPYRENFTVPREIAPNCRPWPSPWRYAPCEQSSDWWKINQLNIRTGHHIMIHAETVVQTIRFYDKGTSYGDPYKAIATIQRAGHLATISGLHGNIEYCDYVELFDYLRETGIREVHWLKGDGTIRTKTLKPKVSGLASVAKYR